MEYKSVLGGLLFAGFAKGGLGAFIMPQHLRRRIGRNDLHFITFCCYHRKSLLDSADCRNTVMRMLDEVHAKYGFSSRVAMEQLVKL